mmetsp:Transcript_7713/g.11893  ORF Transcript_7713/g.11893 Transcript_7713/m.11893 type:complete len:94 (+) Transcript_7713:255-536(+)
MSTRQASVSTAVLEQWVLILNVVGTDALRPCFIQMQSFCVAVKGRDFARQPSWNRKRAVGEDVASTSAYLGLQMCVKTVKSNSSLISCEIMVK